jgi:hypothetical protein
MVQAFIKIEYKVAVVVDNHQKYPMCEHGLVVDNGKGLVLVSRAFVPHDL